MFVFIDDPYTFYANNSIEIAGDDPYTFYAILLKLLVSANNLELGYIIMV